MPCGILHADYSPRSLPSRLIRIIGFNLALLLPGQRTQSLRDRCKVPGPAWLNLEVPVKVIASRDGRNGQMWWAHSVRHLATT